ncbi:MAG TPA: HAD family hydrolase [Anaerolineales bacterium]|nr:HAD family hydrolase [Anaerolineales bacterium]
MDADFGYSPTRPERPFLLATDIDGTILGDEAGESVLRSFAQNHRPSFRLAYVTGRYRSSVERLVAEGRLPTPDFICCNVGTDLIAVGDPDNALGRKYAARVGPEWDLETIYRLGVGEGVGRQDFNQEQPPFQAGFDWDGQAQTLQAFHSRLAGLDHFHILASYGEFIDVLPNPLGKGKAVEFLQRELGIDPARVVVAGDSGNDREMFETAFRGILPVNALDELKAVARPSRHYQSPLPAGQGVLDGLRHFGFVAPRETP